MALALSDAVHDMIRIYQSRLLHPAAFDPATSTRNFAIAASDFGHLLLLPSLHERLVSTAPFIHFTAAPLGEPLIERLEAGEVDVAVGGFPNLYAGVLEQTLFRERYVCLLRRDHPLAAEAALTMQAFKRAHHVIVAAHNLGHVHQEVEKRLLEICPRSQIRVISQSFVLAALFVERTDLVLTVPSRVAEMVGARDAFAVVEPPVALPGFDVKQYWHQRFHQEPGSTWLRRQIAGLFGDGPEAARPSDQVGDDATKLSP